MFDVEPLTTEVSELPDSAWITHPAGLKGNSAVPLISRDGGMNDDFHGAMSATPWLRRCHYLQQAMASFGEVLGRSRLMKLSAGAEVVAHVDFNYHWYTRVRIHVPIITNRRVEFHCGGESLHMQPGECWIFNSWRRHRVANTSDRDRVHLVIDAAGSSRFWAIVREMQKFDPVADRMAIEQRLKAVPYDPEKTVEVLTETYNVCPVMSPGEVDALVKELVDDFENNNANDASLVSTYKILLTDFTKDWREIWHLHGYRKEGWPRYRAAIDKVQRQLHPDNRALLMRSNDVGVNPVIVQRILRAALATDQFDRFVSSS
jgi:hypothetical protein